LHPACCTIEAAQAMRRKLVAEFDEICNRIVPLRRAGADVAPMLLDCNLISGVVDAGSLTM
jgi:hypothetical protein